MAGTVTEVQVAAAWAFAAMVSSGYGVDFTVDTLSEADRFLGDQVRNGRVRRRSVVGRNPERLLAVGAYLGEVIRRRTGGTWDQDELDRAEQEASLLLGNGERLRPIRYVRQLFDDEARPGMAAYAAYYASGPGLESPAAHGVG